MRLAIAIAALTVGLVAPLQPFAQDKAAAAASLSSAELRTKIQSDKKGIVQRNLPLTDAEAAKFWPLYESFQKELAGPQAQVNRAIGDYVSAEKSMTDANAKRLIDQVLKAQADEAKLFTAQFAKVLKVLPATKAARYMQLENKMRAVVNYEIARAIPLVP